MQLLISDANILIGLIQHQILTVDVEASGERSDHEA